jgi:hypothetical protein
MKTLRVLKAFWSYGLSVLLIVLSVTLAMPPPSTACDHWYEYDGYAAGPLLGCYSWFDHYDAQGYPYYCYNYTCGCSVYSPSCGGGGTGYSYVQYEVAIDSQPCTDYTGCDTCSCGQ